MKFAINYEEIAYYFNVAYHLAYQSGKTQGNLVFFQEKNQEKLQNAEKIQHIGFYMSKSKKKNFIMSGSMIQAEHGINFSKDPYMIEEGYVEWLKHHFQNGVEYGDQPMALGLVDRNMPYGNVASMGERLFYQNLGTSYEFQLAYIDLSPLEYYFPFYNSNGIFGDSIEDLEQRIAKNNPGTLICRCAQVDYGKFTLCGQEGSTVFPLEKDDLFPPVLDSFGDRLSKECGGIIIDGLRPDYNAMDRILNP